MSQQGGSSMVSSSIPNSEVKYQKALKQISKLINTNKNLKTQSEERQQLLMDQLNEIAMKCDEMERKYEESENQKRRMQEFLEELQDTNQDLRKEYQTLERQVGYLNEVLTEQNAELKKLSIFKDEKGISELFRSYEQRQNSYKQEVNRLQEQIARLKTVIDRIQQDLIQQTEMRRRYEDQYNIIGLQISKYRQLNSYLVTKSENLLSDQKSRNQKGAASQHDIEGLVVEFKKQLSMLRNTKYQTDDAGEKQYIKNYEFLMEEKNEIALELAKAKDQLSISEQKIKQMYEIEEKMTKTLAKSEILMSQNNMLKNRITILESKQIIDGAGIYEDSDLKVFEEKINYMIDKADPLETIKNSDDNTHFITMKSFVTDLQGKLHNVVEQKKSIQKKYKHLKIKFVKKTEQNIIFEENSKILKGKLQSYERLAEKLNYELEKSVQAHEDQIVKMVAITNNLVSKKVQQSKAASAFIKSQFDIELQKAQKTQKTITQQLQTLKLQNGTLKIKLSNIEQKQRQTEELITIYRTKFDDLSARYKQIEKLNSSINQKLIKAEQLYQEEKVRHEIILVQKQNVSNKLSLVSEELNQKTYSWEDTIKQKQINYEGEVKRSRQQIQRLKDELQELRQQNAHLSLQLDQHRSKQVNTIHLFKQENQYFKGLELKLSEVKKQNEDLNSELISLKSRIGSGNENKKHLEQIESQLMRKNDELNDIKRANINLKRQIDEVQLTCTHLSENNQQLDAEVNQLKLKIFNSSNIIFNTTPKQVEARKTIQHLSQEIAVLQSSLRDEKKVSSRNLAESLRNKEEIEQLQLVIHKNKAREQTLLQTISTANNNLLAVQDELFQYKSKYSQALVSNNGLIAELEKTTQKFGEISEELNANKIKCSIYERIVKDLNGVKLYIQQADKMVKRLSSIERLQWQQQREKENVSTLVDSLNNILKNVENLNLSNSSSSQGYSFIPASSFGNLESNYVAVGHLEKYNNTNFEGSYENYLTEKEVTNDSLKGLSTSQYVTNVNFSGQSFGNPSNKTIYESQYRTVQQM